ncbi:MAG TPA: 2-amino-4-hydroxy-6-hydroxymethyldihydropteridine diphosphokinase [Nitrospirae bacterium]|nr:bifunctional folate synthesis protein [bacterium BMS3Abin06]HDH12946.1 2-amino-4-hydroxy-6-hydroxymethyldihydropteridine diphosphokinase [Nitrospirota bacterium]HDZ00434.1 2-amino-4-hydroxy-6-hydroxymethyldihydropteridine diphosphokinase [Nitrospirota bacterium]
MSTAYIGIGSNLGNREENCKKAITILIENGVKVTKLSSIVETEPWGVRNQPEFINMAIKIETGLKPYELLSLLKNIESAVGRFPGPRWGARVIDLDILFYNDLVMKTADLEIPHPRISEREFVLKPLAEIAPDKIHPVLKKSITALFNDISG